MVATTAEPGGSPPVPTAVEAEARSSVVDGDTIGTLRVAILILSRRMRYQLPSEEISPSESAVLARVGQAGRITPGQLAKAEHVQPPSMTRIIERLEQAGFLRREPDPGDRRKVLISRTEAGDDYVARSKQIRTAWLTEQLGKISEADQRSIAQAASALAVLAEQP